MSDDRALQLTLTQEADYAFRIQFDGTGLDDLLSDEPPPLGGGQGPNPSRLLLAAVANCLVASLLFALRKFRNTPGPLRAEIRSAVERNADGRWRIPRAQVALHLAEPADAHQQLDRILAQFEQFCVVTQSVRQGIEVDVAVIDSTGRTVFDSSQPAAQP
jgi:organic hydroperoxide reductase OsmC/OhrA